MPRNYSLTPYHPNIYLPAGWDQGWQAAKQNAGTTPLQLSIFGDSITTGTNTGWANSYITQLVAKLQASYGHFGDYFAALQSYNGPAVTPGWSAGVSLAPYYDGFGNNVYSSSTAASAIATFTTPYACTALDFLWFDDSGFHNQWKYSLDGGAQVAVTGPNDNATHRIAFSGLANSSHTFAWGWQSANACCMAQGICTYVPGATTGLFTARLDGSGASVGTLNGSSASSTKNFSGYPVGAHLAIFTLMANDVPPALAINTYIEYIDQLIRNLRYSYQACSVAFVIPAIPNPSVDDVNPTGFANNNTAVLYQHAIYELAHHHCCAVFDVHARWGPRPFAQGFMQNNNIHPVAAGHTDVYNFISPYIS